MNDIIRRYYDENVEREWERLTRPYHRLEFETTLSLLTRYLPVSGQIIDIGCGPGRYAIELLKRGYSVTLFDLSSGVLDFAVERMQEQGFSTPCCTPGSSAGFNPVS